MPIGLVLCAGLGSRLKPLTDTMPKCMIPVGNKPVLERIADHMNKHGIWRIVVNLHAFPEVVMKHFGQRFLYLYEPVPMGEFATVNLIKSWFLDEPLVTMNGDTLTDVDLGYVQRVEHNMRFFSKKTRRHMGTSIYFDNEIDNTGDDVVDCVYHDIGTPKKLKIARDYYARN